MQVANGSEVSTLVAAADLLDKDGVKVNIVSVISEGLFRDQSEDYQLSVIDDSKPVFGLTAGLPVTLAQLVGAKGKVFGLDHFGYSAPAGVLDEKFGFTGEQVYNQVKDYLSSL
jgi:transketolase